MVESSVFRCCATRHRSAQTSLVKRAIPLLLIAPLAPVAAETLNPCRLRSKEDGANGLLRLWQRVRLSGGQN
jgi:hypothetical protein